MNVEGSASNGTLPHPYTASGAITGGRAVKNATTGTEDKKVAQAGAGDTPMGIALDDAETGEGVTVVRLGRCKLQVNGASVNIAAGDSLKPAAGGSLVKAATTGNKAIAFAEEPATADGLCIDGFVLYHVVP